MHPTYLDPDAVEPRYTIYENGAYRYTTNPTDLKGIAKQVTLLPPTLGSFLWQQYDNGALREVGVLDICLVRRRLALALLVSSDAKRSAFSHRKTRSAPRRG
jgi:hypothetical protein